MGVISPSLSLNDLLCDGRRFYFVFRGSFGLVLDSKTPLYTRVMSFFCLSVPVLPVYNMI